ncbi:SDR family oxidoreductase [Rhodococcus sp. ABRD24]|uniref:SDR family NAD(P)-dependent oxidoreductase n=1 Tax=Rhodococcus sp. ABRD24 TaxID=2507582 RepID=UPI00103CC4F6|nr:SDR family NAD(P)-dependent oxidoreductase [Rhodococcus sp. ABRD24]QBJ96870.1 SDR family oxidoreductase [Rhodococcus sp. ABRD24]
MTTQNIPSGNSRVIVVTGASSGIGKQIAITMSPTGDLALIARRKDRLDELAADLPGKATVHPADLTDPEQVAEAAAEIKERHGEIDILINCAGARPDRVLTSMEYADVVNLWDQQVLLNLTSAAYTSFAFAPFLRRNGGRIINISSIAAVTGGRRPGSTAYAAAKAGVHGLTLGLSRELAEQGITVNTVAPGFIADTEFTGAWGPEITGPLIAETPVGRAGTVHDIADAVAFLASAEASFITGANLGVNGGTR